MKTNENTFIGNIDVSKTSITGYIYFIENKLTSQVYVGATIDFERRMRQHLCKSRYTDWRTDLHEHPENYVWGILEVVSAKDIIDLNIALAEAELKHYNEISKEYGMFNINKPTINYQRGSTYTDERKLKAKEAHIGKPHKSKVDEELRETTREILRNMLE